MTRILMAMAWAAFILGSAIWVRSQGLSEGASLGVIAGLSGVALGALNSDLGCNRGCAQ